MTTALTPEQLYQLRNDAARAYVRAENLYLAYAITYAELQAARREYDDAQARVRLLEATPASISIKERGA